MSVPWINWISYHNGFCRNVGTDIWAYLSLASGESDVDESAGVCDSLLRSALRGLGLLLLVDL